MKKSTKVTLVVVGSLTVLGAVLATNVVAAQDEMPNLFSRAAEILGVEEDEMETAFNQAWEEEVNNMLEEGKITEEQAEKMLEHGFPFARRGKRRKMAGPQLVRSLADYLDLEVKDLIEQWSHADNLAQVIEENGKNAEQVEAFLIKEAKAKVDEAVESGKIDAERGEEIKEKIDERVPELLYELPAPPQVNPEDLPEPAFENIELPQGMPGMHMEKNLGI